VRVEEIFELRAWGDSRSERNGHEPREIRDNAFGIGPGKLPLLPFYFIIY
jgi:hypothetical protein